MLLQGCRTQWAPLLPFTLASQRGRGFLPEEVGPHQRGQEGAGTGQGGRRPVQGGEEPNRRNLQPTEKGHQRPGGRGQLKAAGDRDPKRSQGVEVRPPLAAGASVWGGALCLQQQSLLPSFLLVVVGASPWHPVVTGYLVCHWQA
jgi:hypothetical protein